MLYGDITRKELFTVKAKEQKTGSKKTLWITLACFVAAVAFIAGVVLLSSAEREAVLSKTLLKFYNALYIDGDLDTMKGCIAEGRRDAFESVMTTGGAAPGFYMYYVSDATMALGEDFSIDVRINQLDEYPTSALAILSETFPHTDKAVRLQYNIIFTTAAGEEQVYDNEMIMVHVGGRWYMTTHLTLPIGANMAAE